MKVRILPFSLSGLLAAIDYPTRTMLGELRRRRSSTELGPEQIIDAVYANQSVYDVDEAVMGLPRLQDFGSEYVTDYRVTIPLDVTADVDLAPFVFDLPDDPVLDGTLGELGGFYGIESIDDIAAFEGQIVPIEWPDGYPQPNLDELRGDEE